MAEPQVRVETRQLPSGDGRQISQRRHGTAALEDREAELRQAVHAVLATMTRAVDGAPAAELKVGKVEVAFNVAFAPDEGVYICSAGDAAFSVKVSLELPAG